jgi:hypothetical protein
VFDRLGFAGCVAVVLAGGCRAILGTDDYRVREGCQPREIRTDAGACAAIPTCSGATVASPGGSCEAVGVTDCGTSFDADGEGGCVARVAATSCPDGLRAQIGSDKCLSMACLGDPIPNDNLAPRDWPRVWIDPQGIRSAAGSPPTFRSMHDAFAAYPGQSLVLLILEGTLHEHVSIDRPVAIQGRCANKTHLVSDDGTPAMVVNAPDAFVSVSSLSLDGGGLVVLAWRGPGSSVSTAPGFGSLRIHDTPGPGIEIDDAADLKFEDVLIERATGEGVSVRGSRVTLSRLDVRDTRPHPDGVGGVGIGVHASSTLTSSTTGDGGLPPTGVSAPSIVTIQESVVEGSRLAGVMVEGSTAHIARSLVRDTGPDGWGRGRGIDVRDRLLGSLPAVLDLDQTVVERSYDVGVRLEESTGSIRRTTIRDTGVATDLPDAGAPVGAPFRCLGNAVRIRNRAPRDLPKDPDVTIADSSVVSARESGIHVEGARVAISKSRIRDVAASCTHGGGDGVAIYADVARPAAATVASSRIEGTARAAIASFDAMVDVAGSTLASCEGASLVAAAPGAFPSAPRAVCGCASGASRCSAPTPDPALASALVGRGGCKETDGFACMTYCYGKFTSDAVGGDTAVPGNTWWIGSDDAMTPGTTDATGCATLPVRRGVRALVESNGGDCSDTGAGGPCPPGIAVMQAGQGEQSAETVHIGSVGLAWWLQAPPPDPRNAITPSVMLCDVSAPSTAPWRYCGRYAGLAGARVTLDGAEPQYYTTDSGVVAAATAGTSTVAAANFAPVTPGYHTVSVAPLDGGGLRSLSCSNEWPTGSGWLFGTRAVTGTTFRVLVEGGGVNVLRLFCTAAR